MIGHEFMGSAHSQAWRVAPHFFDLPLRPEMAVLCGRNPERTAAAAERLGWAEAVTDWKSLLERDDVDVVDICSPGDTHAEIAVAALDAGKHVLCEKPLANTVEEAEAMAAAAERAAAKGVRAMVGFTYRRVPALSLARDLVAQGKLGRIHHVRAQYLQDWIVDPAAPLSWRLQKDKAGSGSLGDIGAHIVDAAQFILGDTVTDVCGMMETFVKERPLAAAHSGLSGTAVSDETGPVTVDDAALFLARFGGGALGSFEATRFASGRKNALRIEVNGSDGSVAFDFEDMNVLHYYHGEDADLGGFRRIVVTEPDHPYVGAWWPPGHVLGYEHAFTHQAVDFVTAIAGGTDPSPSFADGLRLQRVLAAVEASAASRTWHTV
ncbi:Gfo/Idh/MocA family protein [Saccharothrix variisporea]|nr:Gfo/Idh/MocA family oxidoreductase [Saccharothrix variisporea]